MLGWSRVDRTLPRAPTAGFIGMFGVDGVGAAHAVEKVVGEAGWYHCFDSTNVSIRMRCMRACSDSKSPPGAEVRHRPWTAG